MNLKTTAGAMLISAAFLAFRPMMPFNSEVQMRQPTQVAREDATDGGQPCPHTIPASIDGAVFVDADHLTGLA